MFAMFRPQPMFADHFAMFSIARQVSVSIEMQPVVIKTQPRLE